MLEPGAIKLRIILKLRTSKTKPDPQQAGCNAPVLPLEELRLRLSRIGGAGLVLRFDILGLDCDEPAAPLDFSQLQAPSSRALRYPLNTPQRTDYIYH